jgi:hypothetical protein
MVRLLFLCVLLAVGAYLCLADGGQSIMRPDIHLCPEAVIVKKCVKKCNWSIKKKVALPASYLDFPPELCWFNFAEFMV